MAKLRTKKEDQDLVSFMGKELSLSGSNLARLLNVDERCIANWKKGRSQPTASAKGIMVGIKEAINRGKVSRGTVSKLCQSAAEIGGLAYLVLSLLEGYTESSSE